MKQNCWEYKNCGREEGGIKTEELGVCPASVDTYYDRKYGGKNAGRNCWHIDKTLCGGTKQGKFARKVGNCIQCDFFKKVKEEEGAGFKY
jgi:hypothetical protein